MVVFRNASGSQCKFLTFLRKMLSDQLKKSQQLYCNPKAFPGKRSKMCTVIPKHFPSWAGLGRRICGAHTQCSRNAFGLQYKSWAFLRKMLSDHLQIFQNLYCNPKAFPGKRSRICTVIRKHFPIWAGPGPRIS